MRRGSEGGEKRREREVIEVVVKDEERRGRGVEEEGEMQATGAMQLTSCGQ